VQILLVTLRLTNGRGSCSAFTRPTAPMRNRPILIPSSIFGSSVIALSNTHFSIRANSASFFAIDSKFRRLQKNAESWQPPDSRPFDWTLRTGHASYLKYAMLISLAGVTTTFVWLLSHLLTRTATEARASRSFFTVSFLPALRFAPISYEPS
jgi:hypothetical protein